MKIAIYSLFRDNAGPYIDQYFHRLVDQRFPKERLRLYLVEGDSIDNTYQHLLENANWAIKRNLRTQVYTIKTGSPRYGSVVDQNRFDTLNQTANVALDAISEDKWATHILLLESDLLFSEDLVEKLSQFLLRDQPSSIYENYYHNAVAPSVYAGENFYDVWGFIHQDGTPVGPEYKPQNITYQMQSVGSCVLYPAYPVYQGFRFHSQCMRTLCSDFIEQYRIKFYWKDNITVWHPT